MSSPRVPFSDSEYLSFSTKNDRLESEFSGTPEASIPGEITPVLILVVWTEWWSSPSAARRSSPMRLSAISACTTSTLSLLSLRGPARVFMVTTRKAQPEQKYLQQPENIQLVFPTSFLQDYLHKIFLSIRLLGTTDVKAPESTL